jgi:uncharacterized protein YciI
MKTLIIPLILVSYAISVIGQTTNSNYDSTLAKKLGADDYGMKSYILVILKTGSNDIQEKSKRDSLFAGHFENIKRLAGEGKLIVAGPLAKNENSYRGIFILNVKSTEEATELLQTDPTIESNVLDADLYNWYGSAALPEYLKTHRKIEKIQIE